MSVFVITRFTVVCRWCKLQLMRVNRVGALNVFLFFLPAFYPCVCLKVHPFWWIFERRRLLSPRSRRHLLEGREYAVATCDFVQPAPFGGHFVVDCDRAVFSDCGRSCRAASYWNAVICPWYEVYAFQPRGWSTRTLRWPTRKLGVGCDRCRNTALRYWVRILTGCCEGCPLEAWVLVNQSIGNRGEVWLGFSQLCRLSFVYC